MKSGPFIVGIIAIVVTTSVFATLRWRALTATTVAGFWYEDGSFTLPTQLTAKLGGPLTQPEIESIKQISRSELERAFADLRIRFTESRTAFWRVGVFQTARGFGAHPLPNAGQAVVLGPLGGAGAVSLELVAIKAIQFAPAGASRQQMIDGIGRGIGRVAVHEFAHQILGVAVVHNSTDENSYEYHSHDRASQYYGDLHWTIARPLLQQKLGR